MGERMPPMFPLPVGDAHNLIQHKWVVNINTQLLGQGCGAWEARPITCVSFCGSNTLAGADFKLPMASQMACRLPEYPGSLGACLCPPVRHSHGVTLSPQGRDGGATGHCYFPPGLAWPLNKDLLSE